MIQTLCLTGLILLGTACREPVPEPQGGTEYIRGRFHNILGAGIEDVRVCTAEDALCTQTDGSGQFILEGLPDAKNVVIMLDKDGFYPSALPHHTTDSEPPWDKTLLTNGNMNTVANRVDTSLEPGMGHVSFMVHQAHFREGTVKQTRDVRFHIEPDVGASLYYLNGLQLPDPDLEATTGSGGAGALNLPPGDYTLVLDHPLDCERILSGILTPTPSTISCVSRPRHVLRPTLPGAKLSVICHNTPPR